MVKILAVIAASLVVMGYFFTMGIGKSMSTDLSIIGQGKPSLVLAYENFSPTGGEALNRLREVRSDYESRLNFLVADLGSPQGLAFANHYKLFDGQAVFLMQDGQPFQITKIPTDEQELRSYLESKLLVAQ